MFEQITTWQMAGMVIRSHKKLSSPTLKRRPLELLIEHCTRPAESNEVFLARCTSTMWLLCAKPPNLALRQAECSNRPFHDQADSVLVKIRVYFKCLGKYNIPPAWSHIKPKI